MMNDTKLQAIEQVRRFLDGSKELELTGLLTEEKYESVESVLVRFRYLQLRLQRGWGKPVPIFFNKSADLLSELPEAAFFGVIHKERKDYYCCYYPSGSFFD